jgi:hypothetical protein
MLILMKLNKSTYGDAARKIRGSADNVISRKSRFKLTNQFLTIIAKKKRFFENGLYNIERNFASM